MLGIVKSTNDDIESWKHSVKMGFKWGVLVNIVYVAKSSGEQKLVLWVSSEKSRSKWLFKYRLWCEYVYIYIFEEGWGSSKL